MHGALRANFALLGDLILYGYRTRYGRSFLGTLWLFAHPLLLLAVYGLVFSGLMGSRSWKMGGSGSFPLWLASGLLPWLALQESLLNATRSFRENAQFLTRLPTTPELFVVQKVLAGSINLSIFLTLVAVGAFWQGGSVLHLIGALPFLVCLQSFFALGLGLLLAWADLVLADLGHGAAHLLTISFWLTPIVYPEAVFAQSHPWLLSLNPLHHLASCHRACLVAGSWPSFNHLGFVLGFSLACFLLAFALLHPIRREIPDLV